MLFIGMRDHTKLEVWRRAHAFTALLFRTPKNTNCIFPGLLPQLYRSAASIASNIAEGAGQLTRAQYARFLAVAIGSASETQSHLALALEVGLISRDDFERLDRELRAIRAMLFVLRKRVLAEA